MRALFTAIIAGVEAAAVALLGLLVAVVPAILLWMIAFDLAAEPIAVVGSAVAVWMLAHLVPLGFDLTSQQVAGLGLPQQAIDFEITLAPLGLTLITAVFAVRAGWRFGLRGGAGAGAVLGGMAGFGALAGVAAPFAAPLLLWPIWAVIGVPALIYGVCVAAGYLTRAAIDGHAWWRKVLRGLQTGVGYLGLPGVAELPNRAGTVIRMAAAAVTAVLGISSLGVAVAMVAGYVQVATVSQALQLDALGSVLLFLLQLVLLPVAVIWAASWMSGVGFEVGSGTSVTPFETLTGPLPGLPLFGAIPNAWGELGGLAPALVVLCGVLVGVLFARRSPLRDAHWSVVVTLPILAAALAGLAFAGLGMLAHGAIGPDRLAEVGVHGWDFGALAAAELAAGLLMGVGCGRLDTARLRQMASPERIMEAASPEKLREVVGSLGRRNRDPDGDSKPDAGLVDYFADDLTENFADDPDLQQTEPVAFDPELDQSATQPTEPIAADSEPVPEPEPDPEPEPAPEQEPAEVVDELVQAFSWDRLDEPPQDDDEKPGRRRGPRFPRRER